MFWKKKKSDKIPKKVMLLQTYLTGSTVLIPGRERSPSAKAGIQVFILGMADMLRQVESLTWEEFLEIYKSILSQHNILPSVQIENFVNSIGDIASRNSDVENVMKQGAQSIKMWVAERDADAPIDLIAAVQFAEKSADNFAEVVGCSGEG